MAAADADLVSARQPYPQHRRTCRGARQRRRLTQHAHHPCRACLAPRARALLGELPSRTSPAALGALLAVAAGASHADRSEEQTSELQSLMPISYAAFCFT